MRILTLLCLNSFVLLSFFSNAQLTRNNFPNKGDTTTVNYVDPSNFGPQGSGSSQSWDFTGLPGIDSSLKSYYMDPAMAPGSQDFPNANLAVRSGPPGGLIAYTKANSNGITKLGEYIPVQGGFSINFSDNKKEFQYPLKFQDKQSDFFKGSETKTFQGQDLTRIITGNTSITYDGKGKLKMDSGSFKDVMRFKRTLKRSDSLVTKVAGQPTVSETQTIDTSFIFFTQNSKTPILGITNTTNITDFGTNTTKTLFINDKFKKGPSATSSWEKENSTFKQFITFPNPATEKVNIVLGLDEKTQLEILVVNANGKRVIQKTFSDVKAGNFHQALNISSLGSGTYYFKVQTDKGSETRQFVVK